METEKVYQEKTARTIQQKKDGSGILQFVDNRPINQLLQRIGEDEEDTLQGKFDAVVQREEEEEDVLQGKFETPVQRMEEDEDNILQGKFKGTLQRAEEDEDIASQMKSDTTVQKKPNKTGLPDNLKAGVEELSGFSMDDVKVHFNSSQPGTVQALAYTQGTDIHVAPGQEQHLPHEAWHVAQQMAGRVEPTMEVNGMPVNDNAGLEHEADVMGARANML